MAIAMAYQFEPILKRTIYRGIMAAFFTILGISVVLGIVAGILRSIM
jgi:hypothetical protein